MRCTGWRLPRDRSWGPPSVPRINSGIAPGLLLVRTFQASSVPKPRRRCASSGTCRGRLVEVAGEKPAQRRSDPLQLQILRDENETRCARPIRPAFEMPRWMNHVMNCIQHNRRRPARNIEQGLEPEHLGTVRVQQQGEPDREARPVHRFIKHNRDTRNICRMPVEKRRRIERDDLLRFTSQAAQLFSKTLAFFALLRR
jgi:hypothetical protein